MRAITQYQAIDETIWNTELEAKIRDETIFTVDRIMAPLGEVPEDVTAGKGWLQHNLEKVNHAKDLILELCRVQGIGGTLQAFQSRGRDCHPMSIIGRVLSENRGPIPDAWNRFTRIDPQGREHQQPYFAYTNGPDSDHYCVEDRS